MKTWQIYVVMLACGWGLGAVSIWVLGDLAVRAERKRVTRTPQTPPTSPWYLEDQGSAGQKAFLDKIQGRRSNVPGRRDVW